jgi:hypothetical protein
MASLCLAACSESPTRSPGSALVAKPSTANVDTEAGRVDANKDGLRLLDARPAKDKAFSTHSLWITSCDYGVYTVGEPAAARPAMDVLRGDAVALPSLQGRSHEIRVDHYVVYFNPARKLKGMAVGVGIGGMVGAAIGSSVADAGKGSKCPAAKMDGGWYGPGELTTAYSPLIVETAGALDGKPFHSRTVYSPTAELGPKIKKPFEVVEFEAALHKANHAMFESMGLLAAHDAAKPAGGVTAPGDATVPAPPGQRRSRMPTTTVGSTCHRLGRIDEDGTAPACHR